MGTTRTIVTAGQPFIPTIRGIPISQQQQTTQSSPFNLIPRRSNEPFSIFQTNFNPSFSQPATSSIGAGGGNSPISPAFLNIPLQRGLQPSSASVRTQQAGSSRRTNPQLGRTPQTPLKS